jgi:hypothetical protein
MEDPQTELPAVGMEHVWTGLVSVNNSVWGLPRPQQSPASALACS